METRMDVRNARRSSRRPPVLVVGAELCLMIDSVSRDVRINNDRLGTALMLVKWSVLVPDGRGVALDADEQHMGRLQGMGKQDADISVLTLI